MAVLNSCAGMTHFPKKSSRLRISSSQICKENKTEKIMLTHPKMGQKNANPSWEITALLMKLSRLKAAIIEKKTSREKELQPWQSKSMNFKS